MKPVMHACCHDEGSRCCRQAGCGRFYSWRKWWVDAGGAPDGVRGVKHRLCNRCCSAKRDRVLDEREQQRRSAMRFAFVEDLKERYLGQRVQTQQDGEGVVTRVHPNIDHLDKEPRVEVELETGRRVKRDLGKVTLVGPQEKAAG